MNHQIWWRICHQICHQIPREPFSAFITKNFKGSIEETLKDPLKKALAEYKDNPSGNNEQAEQAYKNAWNEVQKEVSLNQVLPR